MVAYSCVGREYRNPLFMAFITGMTYDLISKEFYGTTSIIFLYSIYKLLFKDKHTRTIIVSLYLASLFSNGTL